MQKLMDIAVDTNEKIYLGTPCTHGHGRQRYYAGRGCVECVRLNGARPEYVKVRNARRRQQYKESLAIRLDRKNRNLIEQYGLSISEREEMLKAQDYTCAICPTQDWENPNGLVVDHDHTTGVIRQLLCTPCNLALGALQDSPETADRAATYLRKHGRT